jgi:DNA-directed RNA polymerase subunit RPC12/RpoP
MTQKTLGYTELEWICKRCQTKNPGTVKVCSNCGAPMAQDDQFELPAEQKLVDDEAKIDAAQKGADIHCPYCGARNAAGTKVCGQCGGDISEGALRQAGKILGAYKEGPAEKIPCPYCGMKVEAGVPRCPNCGGDLSREREAITAPVAVEKQRPAWMLALIIGLVVLCLGSIVAFIIYSSRTTDVRAEVESVNWQRSIEILEEKSVSRSNWLNQLPDEAENISCEDKYRYTQDEPAPKSTEVCGTPYTIDEGSGLGKVVQDCVYEVHDSYCEYTILEWQVVDTLEVQGDDLNPEWPAVKLAEYQRQGDRDEVYTVIFASDGEVYSYTFSDPQLYTLLTDGSQWMLKVNAFGAVTGIER